MTKVCKLCSQNKKLINAHIVPKCFYKELIPDGEKYEPFILISKGVQKRSPNGSYDSNILCGDCDSYLGTLDNYGYKLLSSGKLTKVRPLLCSIDNADYDKFGVFILSMFWRASISERPEFKSSSLGEKYENLVKHELQKSMNNQLHSCNDYFVIINYDEDLPREIYEKNIMLPYSYKFHGINVTETTLPGGYRIIMKFDQRQFTESLNQFVRMSRDSGKVLCLLKDNFSNSSEFKTMLEMF